MNHAIGYNHHNMFVWIEAGFSSEYTIVVTLLNFKHLTRNQAMISPTENNQTEGRPCYVSWKKKSADKSFVHRVIWNIVDKMEWKWNCIEYVTSCAYK